MSLILPTTAIPATAPPEPLARRDGADPYGASAFSDELNQALGLGPPRPSADPPAPLQAALDPTGAAMRALLGEGSTEPAPVEPPLEMGLVEGAEPPATADPVLRRSEPLGELVTQPEVATEPEGTTQPAGRTEPKGAIEPKGATEPEVATEPEGAIEPEGATEPEGAVESTGATQPGVPQVLNVAPAILPPLAVAVPNAAEAEESHVTAEARPATPWAEAGPVERAAQLTEPRAAPTAYGTDLPAQTTPNPQEPSRQGERATTGQPTFGALVDLITETQAFDAARPPEPQTEAEPPQSLPVPHRLDAVKEGAGPDKAPTTPEPRPQRSVELPASAILNQVSRSIRLLTEGTRSELHVKLHPAELGEILVRLTVQERMVTAHLQTSDAAVKAALDANLEQLRGRFEQQGLQVNALAVSTGAGQLTEDGQAKSGWNQSAPERGQQNRAPEEQEEEPTAHPTPTRRILGRRFGSRLDHFA